MLQLRFKWKVISRTQEKVFFGNQMTLSVTLQNFVCVRLEPLLGSGQVLDVPVHRRLDTKERCLVVSPHTERVSSIDIVPTLNREMHGNLEEDPLTSPTSGPTNFVWHQDPSAHDLVCLAGSSPG